MSDYMAHGYCFLWDKRLVWLHVISGILTGLAYFSIPVSMVYFLFKRRDFPFTHMAVVFTLIFFSCGITHFFSAYTIFDPLYWQEGYVKAVTALISIIGAIMFIPMIPKALALPSLHNALEEIKGLNKTLAESESRMRTLLQTIPDLIWLKDPDGVYLSCNAMAERVLGAKEADIVGKTDYDFFDRERADFFRESDRKVMAAGRPSSNEEWLTFADDGHHALMHTIKTPMHDDKGNLIGVLGIAHDITERRKAEKVVVELNRDLSARNAELLTANRELEAFSYSVAHDLRAPIRHMSSYVELLDKNLGSQAGDKAKHYMTVIAGASKKMSMLIDDLLAFFSIGRTDMNKTTVSIPGIIIDVIREMAPDIKGREVEWKIGSLPDVYGDKTMLRLAIVNLISNAIKYTAPRAKAEIQIGCTEEAEEFIFIVKDNGVGFDMKYVDKIFGVFQRLHQDAEFEGTGIGLANVQRIISRHGGRTWAEGVVGQGAVFYFTIPKIKEI
jgi:PAS domain S-box-containing protein